MRRVGHDLAGVAQRLHGVGERYSEEVNEVTEIWHDAKGRAFVQQHASQVQPAVTQLVSTVRTLHELFEDIAKKLRDPQQS
jgi:uncharacterized protein YukE